MKLIPKDEWTAELKEENRILQSYFYDDLLKAWSRDLVPFLHHYTRADVLPKIVRSKTIRLYSVIDMPDKEEFRYPLRIVWAQIEPYWNQLVLDIPDLFNPRRSLCLEDCIRPFAACFCEAEESEFMWQEYADWFKGVSIKVDYSSFGTTPHKHAVYPMVYDEVEFEKVLVRFFDYLVGREWTIRFNCQEGKTLGLEACLLLLHFLVRIKRQEFYQECEWRALKMQSVGDSDKVDERGKHFVEIPMRPEYLSAVVLGSKCPLHEAEVEELLKDEFPGVPVLRSKLS
jgi:hypothetical protein